MSIDKLSSQMSIAEALRELTRIDSLLPNRYANIARYCSKKRNSKDEVEKQAEYVKAQAQSARDLIARYAAIKLRIQSTNLTTSFEYNGKQYSIAEALLYKQGLASQLSRLYASFNTDNAEMQISQYTRRLGNALSAEDLEKIDMVPETYYDEKAIQKEKEDLVGFLAMIDALIDKSNHSTYITL